MIVNSPTDDFTAIKATNDRQNLACQLCRISLSDEVEVTVDIHAETAQSLNAQGYVYSRSNKTYIKSQGTA